MKIVSRSEAAAIIIMPAIENSSQRVVLAHRQTLAADRPGRRTRWSAGRRCTRMMLTNRPKLSARIIAEARRVPAPQQHESDQRERQADDAERANRHLLALAAERLGHHGGQCRQGDADHRDDGSEGGVAASDDATADRAPASRGVDGCRSPDRAARSSAGPATTRCSTACHGGAVGAGRRSGAGP